MTKNKYLSPLFVDLLTKVPTAAPAMYKKLPVIHCDTRPAWVKAGYQQEKDVYNWPNASTPSHAYMSLRILLSLFNSVGLHPCPGSQSMDYASTALMAVSHMLATVAMSVSTEDPRFTVYTDWMEVLKELENYHNNLLTEEYCLAPV